MSLQPILRRLAVAAGYIGLGCISAWSATFYVDCNRPNDLGDGRTLAAAKQTIQAAVDLAADNDTVLVAKGVYDKGGKARSPGELNNRVFVSKVITIKAMSANPADTVIAGVPNPSACTALADAAKNADADAKAAAAKADEAAKVAYAARIAAAKGDVAAKAEAVAKNAEAAKSVAAVAKAAAAKAAADAAFKAEGLGPAAIRGYLATDKRSELVGFTLKNGYTFGKTPDKAPSDVNQCGGGAAGGTLKNCVIVDCKAVSGGGRTAGSTYNSVIRNNYSVEDGGAGAYQCDFYNCDIIDNTSALRSGAVYFDIMASNCVFRGNFAPLASVAGVVGIGTNIPPPCYHRFFNCLMKENRAEQGTLIGAGPGSVPLLVNCTVVSNTASGCFENVKYWTNARCAGLDPTGYGAKSFFVTNCIIRFNFNTSVGLELNYWFTDESTVSHSCIWPDVTGKPYDKGGNITNWPAPAGMGASGPLGAAEK
ncbi:MAG: hypothetical protein PHW60_10790 [Kiritimatiellae bacterium]|nr:hypothetical protein [Kiritimatiellia bacterium]